MSPSSFNTCPKQLDGTQEDNGITPWLIPPSRAGGDPACMPNYAGLVDVPNHAANSHGYYVDPTATLELHGATSTSYPIPDTPELGWYNPGLPFEFSGTMNPTYHNTEVTVGGHATHEADRLTRPAGVGDDFSHAPVPHATIQGANTMCFRTRHRTSNSRSCPYSTVNRQERNQGTICNGNIFGNVNQFTLSNGHGAILQYLNEHAATGAVHDSYERFPPPLCHPRTREAVISHILTWYHSQGGSKKTIMWVHAPAGYGKTAIAGTVAERLERRVRELGFNPLGATFFFWRASPERNSPARFIITLAYQLFVSIPELAPHIENAVKRNPMVLTKALEVQMKKLIVEPFLQVVEEVRGKPSRLVIVDGLDECINSDRESRVEKKYAEHQERVQIRVLDLIHALASYQLPLSFLVLSRPESWIKQHIEGAQFRGLVEVVDLYKMGDHLRDVEMFVKDKLSKVGLGEGDDDGGLTMRLLEKAGGHMLYASTAIRHIENPYCDPRVRLRNILNADSESLPASNPDIAHSTPFSSLYELYMQIMRSCPEGTRACMIEVLEDILGPDVSGFNAQRVDVGRAVGTLDALSGRVAGTGMKAIRGLNGVLNLCGASESRGHDDRNGETSQRLEFFVHSSFREFLLDPRLSREFYIDRQKGRRRLLSGCLTHMSSISLDSQLDEDHLRYAVAEWEWVWFDWVKNAPKPDGDMLSTMFQRLLDIDLESCFLHAFTCGHLEEVVHEARLSLDTLVNGYGNPLIPSNLLLYDIDLGSHPLAQSAVTHVRASCEGAILHLLGAYDPTTKHYNNSFYFLMFVRIHNLMLGEVSDAEAWNSEKIVGALRTLKEGPTEHFRELVMELRGKVESIADVLDIGVEDIEAAITYI